MKYSFNTIFYEATRRCNLSCPLCMSSSNVPEVVRKSIKRELSTEEIEERVLGPAHEIGIQVITWSGGEFLLRKDAVELIRRATRHGYQSSVCTNGLSVTKELLRELRTETAQNVLDAVNRAVQAWTAGAPPADDITLVAARRIA